MMTETTKKKIRILIKAIPWIYLVIYGVVWVAFVHSLDGVYSGDVLLDPEYEYTLSQLTAYMMTWYLGSAILLGYVLIRIAVNPRRSLKRQIKDMSEEIADLDCQLYSLSNLLNECMDKIKLMEEGYEEDLGYSDGESDAERSVENRKNA